MENDWRKWCRLCAKEDIVLNSVNVFSTAENDGKSLHDSWSGERSLTAAIGKFFWVNISKSDDMPKLICKECFALLSQFVDYSERIEKVQKMFCLLQNKAFDKTNFNEVRFKCGLVDDDQKNLMPESPTTVLEEKVEVYCLDEIHKIYDFVDNLQDEDTQIENPLEPKRSLRIKNKLIADIKVDDPVENCNMDDNDEKDCSSKIEDDENGSISSILEQYSCDVEQEEYTNKKTQNKTHLPMKKSTSCTICDRRFNSKWLLQRHVKNIHTKERPFSCEQCGFAVYSAGNLKQHMLTHTDYAPFECDICKECFKHNSALRRHQEIHDDNKYLCSECGKSLSSRSTLNRHLLIHFDKIKHKCDYCGREFNRANALKTHLILHTGLKPYACDFCDRTFANGSNCRKHKKIAHPTELAYQKAAGLKSYKQSIPKMETLKSICKSKNISRIVSKQSKSIDNIENYCEQDTDDEEFL